MDDERQGVRALSEVPADYDYAKPGVLLPTRTEQAHIALGRASEKIRALGRELRREFERLEAAREEVGGHVQPEFDPHVQAALDQWRVDEEGLVEEPLEVPSFIRQ